MEKTLLLLVLKGLALNLVCSIPNAKISDETYKSIKEFINLANEISRPAKK